MVNSEIYLCESGQLIMMKLVKTDDALFIEETSNMIKTGMSDTYSAVGEVSSLIL